MDNDTVCSDRVLASWWLDIGGICVGYNYFRDYDPSIGRYIQSDPIGLAGGINTYSDVGGNPLSYSDPSGLVAPWVLGAAAGGLFSGGFNLVSQLQNNSGSINWGAVGAATVAGAVSGGSGAWFYQAVTTGMVRNALFGGGVNMLTNLGSAAIGNQFACPDQMASVTWSGFTGYYTGFAGGLLGAFVGNRVTALAVSRAISGVNAVPYYVGGQGFVTGAGNAVSNSNAFSPSPSMGYWP